MREPTARQLEVLRYVAARAAQDYPPTLRELCTEIGTSCTNGARDHLRALRRKGLLRINAKRSRGITVTAAAAPYLEGLEARVTATVPVMKPSRCEKCDAATFAPDLPCFMCRLLKKERAA